MKTIGIVAPLKSPGLRRMLDALGEVLNVSFVECSFGEDEGIDAWVFPKADRETLHRIAHSQRSCYAVIGGDHLVRCGESSTIEFSPHKALPPMLRGRQISTDEAVDLKALPRWLQDFTVVASKGVAPFWTIQEFHGGGHHHVALPIPELNDGEPLFQYFYGERFLSLFPLLVFLRILTEDQRWEPPPLQACFMFDDPNLHWRTYGFIDYAEMIKQAQLHNYHVSFATIPLDAWFVHLPAANFFKQYNDKLSLLIHGNDHVNIELARPYSDEERNGILRQALIRIAKLERRSGVEVSRVMVPPHGACSESVLKEMANLGFEAACVSRWSLRHYNGQASWLSTFGMRPSEMIEGLTIFPRFRMSRTCHNSILVAAFLHQPIIAIGHHQDVAEGLLLLRDLSGFINSLGNVKWADMQRISRSHYSRRYDGKILRVNMFTKRIEICVPEGINQIFAERSWIKGAKGDPLAWRILGEKMEWDLQRPDESIPALPGQKIEIISAPPTTFLMDTKVIRKLHLWPILRRQLTEARDRMAPVLKRVSALSKSSKKNN